MLSLQDHQTTNFIERDKKGTFFFGMYFTTIGVSPGFFSESGFTNPGWTDTAHRCEESKDETWDCDITTSSSLFFQVGMRL